MNEEHLRLCASPEWARTVRDELLPWAVGRRDLGDDVLEVGAGPGATTDVLRELVPRLTAVEVDHDLAAALASRLHASNVAVVQADGTALPFRNGRFSAVTCFTMLHHVPSSEAQDRLLAELRRVLRPGGLFLGIDALDLPALRELHVGDVFVPVEPSTLPGRLRAAGFADCTVETDAERLRFVASAPRGGTSGGGPVP